MDQNHHITRENAGTCTQKGTGTTRSGAQPAAPQSPICFIRTVGLVRGVAIGSSLTIGLNIFILLSLFLHRAGPQTPSLYLAALVLFLPIVLTCAERGAVIPGGGGMVSLVRAGGAVWRTYATGWLLLGGHLSLIALLGWGSALYLNISMERLMRVSLDPHWLAPALVIVVMLNDIIGTRSIWRTRTFLMYGGMVVVLIAAVWSWFVPGDGGTGAVGPGPGPVPGGGVGVGNPMTIMALMAAGLWGINAVLDKRDEIRQPGRILLPSMLLPLTLSAGLGAVAALSAWRLPAFFPDTTMPPSLLSTMSHFGGIALLEAAYVSLAFLFCLIALDKAMVMMIRLIGAMAQDGFLPKRFVEIAPGFGTPIFAIYLFAAVSTLAAAVLPNLILVGMTALMLVWATLLFNAPESLRAKSSLPVERSLKLPFHPLFPSLATVIGVFLPLALPPEVLLVGVGWVLVGAVVYVRYARRGSIEVRRREEVVGDVVPDRGKKDYTLLVCAANPDTIPALVQAGVVLARPHRGRLMVLNVAAFPEQVPEHVQRQQAREQFNQLQRTLQRIETREVGIEPIVRLSQSPVDGILGTAQEQRVDVILLGWEGSQVHQQFDLGPLLDPVIRAAAHDVVVLRGALPESLHRILVPIDGTPNSLAALRLAQQLVDTEDGHVVALNVVQDMVMLNNQNSLEQARSRFQPMVDRLKREGVPPIDLWVVPSESIKEGILHEAQNADMVLLGASQGGVMEQSIFGGVPVEVARSSPVPTLLVKHYEGGRRFWLRQVWEKVTAPVPNLTPSERAEVYQRMHRAARPSVDFFVLICLAAMIATLGLLQSSPAVIIGAMLVAPLMSPIIAMSMGIVRGNIYLLRLSAGAALLGVVMAVSVGIAVTLLSPASASTSEILARTQPNLLDLLVALASGAAGGYAIGRKEVAAAMPGVAIAAALVPPLCVVGYGTATAHLEVAGGALLLFTTNLISIVFAAAVVFLLFGFRPTQSKRRGQVRLGFIVSIVALVAIAIPLGVVSVNAVVNGTAQSQVETALHTAGDSYGMAVTDVVVENQQGYLVVYATMYTLDDVTPAQMAALQDQVEQAVNRTVTLRVTVLRAVFLPDEW